MQRSKTYRAAAEQFDKDELYAPLAAIKLAKTGSKKKFDETVDVAMRLGVDPRKADQMVRGTVNLPHGTGKTARVLVFANGEKAEAAREAGADIVGGDELIEKVDRRLARLRRRRRDPRHDGQGRPPRPRARPARPDAEPEDRHRHPGRGQGRRPTSRAARSSSASTGTPTCTSSSARRRSPRPQLAENYAAALEEVLRLKPASSKGRYIKKVTLSTTMGPGVQVDPNRTRTSPSRTTPGLTPTSTR